MIAKVAANCLPLWKPRKDWLIIDALKETSGNQTKSAKLLGTTKRIIQYKISKMGIDPKNYRKS